MLPVKLTTTLKEQIRIVAHQFLLDSASISTLLESDQISQIKSRFLINQKEGVYTVVIEGVALDIGLIEPIDYPLAIFKPNNIHKSRTELTFKQNNNDLETVAFCIKSFAYREVHTFIFDNKFELVNIVHMDFKTNVETNREQSELKTLEEEILSIGLARKEKTLDNSSK